MGLPPLFIGRAGVGLPSVIYWEGWGGSSLRYLLGGTGRVLNYVQHHNTGKTILPKLYRKECTQTIHRTAAK